MKLYRLMKVDADGKPKIGMRGSMLGVRPTDPLSTLPNPVFDVDAIADTDLVYPGKGLSTSPDPLSRLPRRGEAVFEIETDDLGPELTHHQDHPDHYLLQPTQTVPLGEFQRA